MRRGGWGREQERILTRCVFVSDLHGDRGKYGKLLRAVALERPDAVFLGGDLLPFKFGSPGRSPRDFIRQYLAPELNRLRNEADHFPRIFLILGNDDQRTEEATLQEAERLGLLEYVHQRQASFGGFQVYGYACVPPTPFLLKDWERYDVSRYVDPGCISPEEGRYSLPTSDEARKYSTIKADLERLAGNVALDQAIFLFHAPPHDTCLDRAALDGVAVDGVPLEVHVGSIAIRRFIEERQPLLTLHGHIHESARLSHTWHERIGRTHLFSAAHEGPELALVRFDLESLGEATRELI
jgi:Icc-related predicted phosphoesterase